MHHSIKLLTAAVLLSSGFHAFAGGNGNGPAPIVNSNNCQTTDMWISAFRQVNAGAWNAFTKPNGDRQNATQCLGMFQNANNADMDLPELDRTNIDGNNLGYAGDGWMNYYGNANGLPAYNYDSSPFWSGPGAFIGTDDLQDLETPGNKVDPGWVYLGKDEGMGANNVSFKGSSSTNGTLTYNFIDNLFQCAPTNPDNPLDLAGIDGMSWGSCSGLTKGAWKYTPPATQPQELLDLLGGEFFDSTAVIFKGGNGFVMYEFKLSDLGLDPILAGQVKLEFSGLFDLSDTLINNGSQSAGISNTSLWARDPFVGAQVSAPGSLALSGLGLLLLAGWYRRRQVV